MEHRAPSHRRYQKVLDGLMKVLSIDLRVSDAGCAAMKLRKLVDFGDVFCN